MRTMNKSLKYIKKRIEKGDCYNMTMEEFKDMYVIPFKSYSYFKENYKDHMPISVDKDSGKVFANLTYSPDANFNYFITESCVCDGTLIFMNDLMTNVIRKIGELKSCYLPALEVIPREERNTRNYMFHYEVGDFIANSYIIEPPYKNKPWMRDRFTVMLPVKFTIEKREGINAI